MKFTQVYLTKNIQENMYKLTGIVLPFSIGFLSFFLTFLLVLGSMYFCLSINVSCTFCCSANALLQRGTQSWLCLLYPSIRLFNLSITACRLWTTTSAMPGAADCCCNTPQPPPNNAPWSNPSGPQFRWQLASLVE